MKVIAVLSLFVSGCLTVHDIVPPFNNPYKINETNYMMTPCIIDGQIVKKKPKVPIIKNDTNTIKERKEG